MSPSPPQRQGRVDGGTCPERLLEVQGSPDGPAPDVGEKCRRAFLIDSTSIPTTTLDRCDEGRRLARLPGAAKGASHGARESSVGSTGGSCVRVVLVARLETEGGRLKSSSGAKRGLV